MPNKIANKKVESAHGVHTPRLVYYIVIAVVLCLGFFLGTVWTAEHARREMRRPIATIPPAAFTNNIQAQPTCATVEALKLRQLPDPNSGDFNDHMIRANVFADLVESGCPENKGLFATSLDYELQVARSLRGNASQDNSGSGNIIIYRSSNEGEAAQAARRVIEKAKLIGEPMIQFISSVEKIVSDDK